MLDQMSHTNAASSMTSDRTFAKDDEIINLPGSIFHSSQLLQIHHYLS